MTLALKPKKDKRWCIKLEYDGSFFCGWQRQKNEMIEHQSSHSSMQRPSVQKTLEHAITKLTNGQQIDIYGAGRTDSGVHAIAQCAHFDLNKFDAKIIFNGLNAHLKPYHVAVIGVHQVTFDFHARFSALKRHYHYRILNKPSPSPLMTRRTWHYPYCKLNVCEMQKAADLLQGYHDFTSMRATACQANSPFKTLDILRVAQDQNQIDIYASARSFLHHQVRNMVGTLVEVGRKKIRANDIIKILQAKKRSAAGPTAPAHGLYLLNIEYERKYFTDHQYPKL
ncbi:MAG: tRNA pseudouridine(38-40) synthase TruA [Pseudomonadota bacterium]